MSFTNVYSNELHENSIHRHIPLHLPSRHSFSPCNPFLHVLPNNFSLNNNINRHIPTLPLQHNQNHPLSSLSSNNIQNRPFPIPDIPTFPELPTGPPLYNTNNHHINLITTNTPSIPQYPTNPLLNFKDSTLPSSMYIPLLTGRADWGAWSDMVSTAVINMNLYGHIAEKYSPKYGYDPGAKLTFPPIIDENATTEEVMVWHDWWRCDAQSKP